ncbi:probable carboxylesterase 12 [Euphorbia lathyris]|uniref:probable carboxylesterase 12 n=1 Tax=Euphorbia lathyris TaxID=212925 RepID=UPI0033144850
MAMASADNELTHDFRFFKVYKDGRIDMKITYSETIPPSDDPATGVRCKDVTISTEPQVSVRIFLPKLHNLDQKIPLLFYIHGGGFSIMSASSPQYDSYCKSLAAESNFMIVSVEYGLFPTRPIPACYDDSWAALQWVASHVNGSGPEKWLNDHADFEKVFVGGDSAGGNISHTLAYRVGAIGLPAGVKLVGAILVHPYFGGSEDDHMWLYMCPSGSGLDDPRMNPPLEDIAKLGCEKLLIFVAEKDHLNMPGKNYFDKLKKSGWKGSCELVENEKEEHCFHLLRPNCNDAVELQKKIVSFLKQD